MTMGMFSRLVVEISACPQWSSHIKDLLLNPHVSLLVVGHLQIPFADGSKKHSKPVVCWEGGVPDFDSSPYLGVQKARKSSEYQWIPAFVLVSLIDCLFEGLITPQFTYVHIYIYYVYIYIYINMSYMYIYMYIYV